MPSFVPVRVVRAVTGPRTLRVLSVLLVLGLWEWAGRVPISPALPSFTQTIAAFGEMLADGTFLNAYSETILPLVAGMLFWWLGGMLAGIIMRLSTRAEWL